MREKKNIFYLFFIISIYTLVFQNLFQNLIKPIRYFDELLALLIMPIAFFKLKKNIKVKRIDVKILFSIFLILLTGLLSNLIYKYQPASVYLVDVLLVFKFFGVYLLSKAIWGEKEFAYKYSDSIYKHAKIILYFLFILTILNYILKIWPFEYRFKIMSNRLFYEHPSILAATIVFVLSLMFITNKHIKVWDIIICVILLISTLRMKAIGAAFVICAIGCYVYFFDRKISISKLGVLAIFVLILVWNQIDYYFIQIEDSARNQLTLKSFEIASDYFPIGTGFGTFASYMSGENYSPVYYLYNLENIYGLEKGKTEFVSDTFWPMIIGQFGILGTIAYIYCLVLIFKPIQENFFDRGKNIYLAKIFCFVYLVISSTSEAAFVHPFAISFAIILGM